jgi:hypothetical protein
MVGWLRIQASLKSESISKYNPVIHPSKPCVGKLELQSFAGVKNMKNFDLTGTFDPWQKISISLKGASRSNTSN